ncbi:hypothetical protein EDC36_104223 [Tepidimonas ignava]|uniref:Methyltransferase family protein n=1 Tax=Tepidimonas ignava TaxID=114249 RepID=A0A4R3LFJ0_9BURK|nr:hypothetical protein [Tepidimonas ignava]TCS98799.1 hypothetical protein EDC36_104223 [Tepidimonas ignava]TSE20276.1 hypothetical protein Tigna_01907 [Tepidimonas ignava]
MSLTRLLYALYGRLVRVPVLGPIFKRWVDRNRHWVYRLRDALLRMDGRIRSSNTKGRLDAIQDQLDTLAVMVSGLKAAVAQTQAWEHNTTALLDQHRHALNLKVDAAVEALTSRVERAERQLAQTILTTRQPGLSPQVLDPAKLAQHMARPQGLWLEVGCGAKPDPDRINVDMRPLPGVDIVAPAHVLPLPDACVQRLRAAHLVEHFTLHDLRTRVLPEWRRVLAPGATLELITPDLQAMLQAHLAGAMTEADLVHVLYGGQDYEGDFHYHAYSPESLMAELAASGFSAVECVARGRRNGLCFECEVHARRAP